MCREGGDASAGKGDQTTRGSAGKRKAPEGGGSDAGQGGRLITERKNARGLETGVRHRFGQVSRYLENIFLGGTQKSIKLAARWVEKKRAITPLIKEGGTLSEISQQIRVA